MYILHGISRLGGGGAERQLRNLVCESSQVLQHRVFTLQAGGFENELRGTGIKVDVRPLNRWKLPLAILTVVNEVRRCRPDILQSWDPQFDVLFGVVAIITHVQFIGSERNSALQYQVIDGYGKAWFRRLRGPIMKRTAALIIANSRTGLRYVDSITDNKVRCVVVRNGIDLAELDRKSCNTISLPDDVSSYIVVSNRLSAPKRTRLALDIFDAFADLQPMYALIVLGTGPEERELMAYAQSLRASDRIHFVGHVSNVAAYIRQSSAFLSSSAVEGMPNSVIESMALGVPVILSRIDAHEELCEDSDGAVSLYDPNTPQDGAIALDRIITDQSLRASLIEKAQRYACALTIERMVHDFTGYYEDIA